MHTFFHPFQLYAVVVRLRSLFGTLACMHLFEPIVRVWYGSHPFECLHSNVTRHTDTLTYLSNLLFTYCIHIRHSLIRSLDRLQFQLNRMKKSFLAIHSVQWHTRVAIITSSYRSLIHTWSYIAKHVCVCPSMKVKKKNNRKRHLRFVSLCTTKSCTLMCECVQANLPSASLFTIQCMLASYNSLAIVAFICYITM